MAAQVLLMADHVSQEARSRIMRAIRSANTQPELTVRRLLFSKGYRYRLHVQGLAGKPDIVFPNRRKVIFIHGCFWHQHSNRRCPISQRPRSNTSYWFPKLARNVSRDRENQEKLHKSGWKVLVLWECKLKQSKVLVSRLIQFLN